MQCLFGTREKLASLTGFNTIYRYQGHTFLLAHSVCVVRCRVLCIMQCVML